MFPPFAGIDAYDIDCDDLMYTVADLRKIMIKPLDGSRESRLVADGAGSDWIPDGSGIVFEHYSEETDSWDVSYKLFRDDDVVPFLTSAANEGSPTISPDGRHLLYISDETGSWEVFARPFPAGDARWQVSRSGGTQPRWSRDGREIYYFVDDVLMAIEVVEASTFSLGRPEQLFEIVYPSTFDAARFSAYAPGLDHQSFFVVRVVEDDLPPNRLMLIQNWFGEFGGSS